MRALQPSDSIHFEAAQGWFELGGPVEAFDVRLVDRADLVRYIREHC